MVELRCDGLAKSYGEREVLRDVDLVVEAAGVTAVLGASGSGKTTLLRLIMGFAEADAGTISIGGRTVAGNGTRVAAAKRGVGYVAQEGALFPHLTAGENVGFGLPRTERRGGMRIAEALALVGLDATFADRRAHELSGGEQRRVALARALAPRPRVVLLDEPFSGLDAGLRAETRAAVTAALAVERTTALLVTHDQAEAMSMGRDVVVLRAGRLVQQAAPTALYRTPVDLDVARFVGEAVVLRGVAGRGRVTCPLGVLAVRGFCPEGPVDIVVRPEQVRLLGPGEAGVGARVVDHVFYGPDTVIRLALDVGGTSVRARTFDPAVPGPGARVAVAVRGPVVVFPRDEDVPL